MKRNHPVKQTTERRISASLRIALVLLLLFLNIASVVILTYFLQSHAYIAFAALELLAMGVAVSIQSSASSSSYKLAWTLLVVALPVAGMILYVLWGGNIQSKRLNLLPIPPPKDRSLDRRWSDIDLEKMGGRFPTWQRAARLLSRRGFLLYRNTSAVYFSSGADFFADASERMEKAERFIFLEYFILAEGRLWDRILSILIDRAKHGVEVKIIFDDFGNITRMRGETIEKMRAEGIEVCVFNPVHQYVNRLYFNYRDHRKILCVDGQYAYTGGINVADEYAGLLVRFGEWKDSGVLLDGPGAWGLTSQFLHMWEMLGERFHREHDYYRPLESRESDGLCQPFSDGPMNNPDNPAEDLYIQCITNAHRKLWLTTPYLAVEDTVVRALCMASDSGVDVRLMLPGIPDHRYTQIVAGSYYERLLHHGVKLYEFTPGFLHTKSLVADGEIALLGTINMDYRSFQLHYECGVAFYGAPVIEAVTRDMREIIRRSAPVELERWEKRSGFRKMLEKVLRIFSIWM